MIYNNKSAEFHREGFNIRHYAPNHAITPSCSATFAPLRECLGSTLSIHLDQSTSVNIEVAVIKPLLNLNALEHGEDTSLNKFTDSKLIILCMTKRLWISIQKRKTTATMQNFHDDVNRMRK